MLSVYHGKMRNGDGNGMFDAIIRRTNDQVTVYAILNSPVTCGKIAVVFYEGEWLNIALDEIIPISKGR